MGRPGATDEKNPLEEFPPFPEELPMFLDYPTGKKKTGGALEKART